MKTKVNLFITTLLTISIVIPSALGQGIPNKWNTLFKDYPEKYGQNTNNCSFYNLWIVYELNGSYEMAPRAIEGKIPLKLIENGMEKSMEFFGNSKDGEIVCIDLKNQTLSMWVGQEKTSTISYKQKYWEGSYAFNNSIVMNENIDIYLPYSKSVTEFGKKIESREAMIIKTIKAKDIRFIIADTRTGFSEPLEYRVNLFVEKYKVQFIGGSYILNSQITPFKRDEYLSGMAQGSTRVRFHRGFCSIYTIQGNF